MCNSWPSLEGFDGRTLCVLLNQPVTGGASTKYGWPEQ